MALSSRSGLVLAVAAHVLWGFFPIYWNLLSQVNSAELACHRIAWAFLFSLIIGLIRFRASDKKSRQTLLASLGTWETWGTYAFAAAMIAINWFSFLWAVNNDRVLLSSLGYYINPLFTVFLGVVVLGERLGGAGWFAIVLAAIGVAVMTLAIGEFPWVSLSMATSFSLYGLTKKRAKLDALNGLLLETTVLIAPTIVYLAWLGQTGSGVFRTEGLHVDLLLVFGGLVTILPLSLFAAASKLVQLSTMGVLQYVGPTLQFLVGVFYFGEAVKLSTLIGFGFVWTGVAIFLTARRKNR